MKKINVAVIGYGHLGRWHAEKAAKLANLVAIVESHSGNIKQAKEVFPEIKVVDDLEKVIDEIDAAIIVTPTVTHLFYIQMLLKHKKHIFCEKPLCYSDEEAKIIEEISNQNCVLQVGHSERFHASWDIIKKYEKFLSDKCVIRMNRFAPFKGRATDVDVVQDLMIHDIDLLVYLLKENPINVKSTGYKIRTNNWDYVCSEFNFKSGVKAFLMVSRNHVKEARDMEVFSDEGCLYVDLFHNQIMIAPQEQTSTGGYIESMDYSKRDHLMMEQEHFYDSIIHKKPAIVGLEDGLLAVRLISKVLQSIETGELTQIEL
jgi:predicted dehydrogenase